MWHLDRNNPLLPRHSQSIAILVALLALACSPPSRGPVEGIGKPAGGAAAADAGVAGLDPRPRGYAVVSSDYSVTSIGLLHADGSVQRSDFIDSGSASTGLVTALSGDVVLPTQSGEHGVLVLLDRLRTDVVTRIDLATGNVLGQVKVEAPNAQARQPYSANPHDYVYISASTAWITRYEPNLGAATEDPDLGLDLLRLDPSHFVRTHDRIDFSPWNGMAERKNPDTGETESVAVYARPSGIVRLGDRLVVGIDSLSAGFDAAGDGMVALVDLQAKQVAVLTLPGLQSCGNIAHVPGDGSHVAVACTGFFRGVPRDGAGLAVLEVGNALVLERLWRADQDDAAALAVYGMIPLSATELLAVAPGETSSTQGASQAKTAETNDKLYRVDLVSGAQEELFEAAGRYVIGGGTYDPQTGLLLVPDASVDHTGRPTAGVQRFKRQEDGAFERQGVSELDAILPPRQVRALE